jgi:hypothetical protein
VEEPWGTLTYLLIPIENLIGYMLSGFGWYLRLDKSPAVVEWIICSSILLTKSDDG